MSIFRRVVVPSVILLWVVNLAGAAGKTENVIMITIDGMRWQDVFTGADPALLNNYYGGVKDLEMTRGRFWRETAAARREAMMPFLWEVIAKQGQIFGDPEHKCDAMLTNGKKISYPGYSEMFCGFADPKIETNDRIPNPNVNVLEWLNQKPSFKGRIAAYGTWDRLPFILNTARNGLPCLAGWKPIEEEQLSEGEREINDVVRDMTRLWHDNAFDVISGHASIEYIKKHRPRVFYLMFGETDEWAHFRRYDRYLESAQKNDEFIQRTWEMAQAMPQYAGKTSLVITTDHGRGSTVLDWIDHNKKTVGAERIWMAVLGPDTPGLGVRSEVAVTQSQIAATVAALLGEDFCATSERVAKPLPGVMK
jgi:hypothetical protein